jgi:predicted O-methyltransferase YrrM
VTEQRAAADRLWAMAGLATPMALRVLATLRVADHLASRPRTATELTRLVDADPDALDRLLRHLAKRGVLARDATGRYALTPLGEPLRDAHPAGIRAWLDLDGAGRAELCFVQLLHSVRTGEAAFPVQFGRSFWDDLAADPDRATSFHALMSAAVRARSRDLVAAYRWDALGHVVDVGGGDGSLLVALLSRYPALRGTVVDRPGTAEVARRALATAGLDDRGTVVAGSFFDPLPPGAGGYVLSLVLHNWGDEAARGILRRCAEAAGPGGVVLAVERLAGGASPHTGMDLRMLAYTGGRERGVAELAALAAGAGLRLAGVHAAGGYTIVELVVA